VKKPSPQCPNTACAAHHHSLPNSYRKRGYRRPKHNHQPVPRYQCKSCGTYFSATQFKPIRNQKRPDLNAQVFALAVSGMTMRRMALLLKCSPLTIERKIQHLTRLPQLHHQKHLATLQTSYVIMDELETFIHARNQQVSVGMMVRVKTGEVLSFGVARKPSNYKDSDWKQDDRPDAMIAMLKRVKPLLKPHATLVSDKKTGYTTCVKKALSKVQHVAHKAIKGPGYNPLFAIDHAFAKMRNELARLSRMYQRNARLFALPTNLDASLWSDRKRTVFSPNNAWLERTFGMMNAPNIPTIAAAECASELKNQFQSIAVRPCCYRSRLPVSRNNTISRLSV
jgi:transposase-like protein